MALWSNRDEAAGKPKFLSAEDKAKTYGVNWDETMYNPGNITDVAIVQGGSNYTEVPNVNILAGEEGQASATATITDGVVTAITVTDDGNGGYNEVPLVFIDIPARHFGTGAVNTTNETISYEAHGLENGDAVIYRAAGESSIVGLTDGDTYYVNTVNANIFKLYDTKAHAVAGGVTGLKNLGGTGNDNQYFDLVEPAGVTATAKAVLGTGSEVISDGTPVGYSEWVSGEQHITHAGWVKKTVGTGGRAGRVQYETLVAMGSMIGDAAGDTAFPSGD